MESSLGILIILFILLTGAGLVSCYEYITKKQQVLEHLQVVASLQKEQEKIKKKSLLEKAIAKLFHLADDFSHLGERINFFSESEDISNWLLQANHPYDLTVSRFQGLKIATTILASFTGALALLLGFPMAEMILLLSPFAGFFYPLSWLKNKAKTRQAELSYALPDFLDMVSVILQAGAGLDQAFREIPRYYEGPIKEEFSRFNHRLSLGIPREELYNELIQRTNVPEFQRLIKSLLQGSQLGVPVATTLKIQSEEIRKLRKEKARETAAKASPKLTLITTFVIMPTAFLFIGGLMLLNIISQLRDSGLFSSF